MRRFIVGWKVLGYARRFNAEIVNSAENFMALGRVSARVTAARPARPGSDRSRLWPRPRATGAGVWRSRKPKFVTCVNTQTALWEVSLVVERRASACPSGQRDAAQHRIQPAGAPGVGRRTAPIQRADREMSHKLVTYFAASIASCRAGSGVPSAGEGTATVPVVRGRPAGIRSALFCRSIDSRAGIYPDLRPSIFTKSLI